MVGRSSGISVRKWMKPNCFARNMRVDYAPTGRAKCNLDPEGPFIAKGEPRCLLRTKPKPKPKPNPNPNLVIGGVGGGEPGGMNGSG